MMLFKFFFILFSLSLVSCAATLPSMDEQGLEEQTFLDRKHEKVRLYLSIGESFEKHGRLIEATKNYQRAIEEDSKFSKAYLSLGKVLLKRQYVKKGVKAIHKALRLNPKYTEARNYLAYFYYSRGQLAESFELVEKSSKDLTYWNQEETWALKLKLDYRLKRYEEIKFSALKALKAEPQSCLNRIEISKVFLKINKYNKAMAAARQAEPLCQKIGWLNKLNYFKSIIFIKQGHLAVAETLLSKIKIKNEKSLQNRVPKLLMSLRKKINPGM